MSNIFVIKVYGGSYDDAYESNLFAVHSEQQAQIEIKRLEQLHADCKEMWEPLYDALQEGYKNIRALHSEDFKLPPEPKGPAKPNKETAAELRKKLAAWRKECEPIWEGIRARQNAIMHEAQLATMHKAIELGATEEHLKMLGIRQPDGGLGGLSWERDAHFSYEELELRWTTI